MTRLPAPALLDDYTAPYQIRRGSHAEVLAALRQLLSRPAVEAAASCPAGVAAAGKPRRAGEVRGE